MLDLDIQGLPDQGSVGISPLHCQTSRATGLLSL